MFIVNELNLKSGWGYRSAPPKGQFKFEFKFDEESISDLEQVVGNYKSERDIEEFETGILESAYKLLFTMDGQELSEPIIPPYIRLVIDPTDENRLFGFQINRTNECLVLSKARIFSQS